MGRTSLSEKETNLSDLVRFGVKLKSNKGQMVLRANKSKVLVSNFFFNILIIFCFFIFIFDFLKKNLRNLFIFNMSWRKRETKCAGKDEEAC